MIRTLTPPPAAGPAAGSAHQFQLIVDVSVLLLRGGTVLLGRRAGTGYGDGAYEPPSGRLAERETLAEAAVRVAAAQAGIALDPAGLTLAHVLHDVSGTGRMAFFLTQELPAPIRPEQLRALGSYRDFGWYPLSGLPANMIDRARVAIRGFAAGARFSTYPACASAGRRARPGR